MAAGAALALFAGHILHEEPLHTVDAGQRLRDSPHGLRQHHQREAQDVEQRQRGEGQGGIQAPHQHLIGGEDDTGGHRGRSKHHGHVDGFDHGVLEVELHLAGTDLVHLLLEEQLPSIELHQLHGRQQLLDDTTTLSGVGSILHLVADDEPAKQVLAGQHDGDHTPACGCWKRR
jgi:hypothetical protein